MEHFTQVLTDNKGNSLKDATVYVYQAGTTTFATIFSDNGVTLKPNPFQTSSAANSPGAYDFYAANGVYDIVFVKSGYSFNANLTKRIALFDVNDGGGGGGGGGGSSAFNDITTGTNVTATMTVGTGANLTFSGGGIINASNFRGNTLIPLADGGTNQNSWTASRCVHVNAAGTALEVTSADCATTATFSGLTGGTNSTAAMIVGTGSSLTTSGSGTITATGVKPNAVALTTDTTGNYVSSATASQGLLLTGTEGASLGLQACANGEILKNSGGTSWICSADSTGGTPTFDTVASGTNTTAAMVVSTGASLSTSGSGTIAATTATALFANGGNCATGLGAGGVSAAGVSENCTDYMEEPVATGLVARTAANTAVGRTITGTANEIGVSNGDGVAANPTVSLPSTMSLGGKTITVGSGGSITPTGSGIVTANSVTTDAVPLGTGTTGNYVASATLNQGLLLTGTEGASIGLTTCADGQILKNVSGTSWACASDATSGLFSDIASGANTTATMTVSTGATLTYSGSGTVNASSFKGNATVAAADGGTGQILTTDDGLLVANGSTFQLKILPGCNNPTLDKLLYDSSSNSFFCGTDQSTGGGTTFNSIGSGTNTTASMTVSTGAYIVTAGTGIIANTAEWPNLVTVNAGNSPYTATSTNMVLFCDTTAAARIINLAAASNRTRITVYNLGSNTCTINRSGADTINTGIQTGLTSFIIRNPGSNFWFKSDESSVWYVGG